MQILEALPGLVGVFGVAGNSQQLIEAAGVERAAPPSTVRKVMERHGYSMAELSAGRETPRFRAAMREAVDTARDLFRKGMPLSRMVDRRLGIDLELFSRGGPRVLEKIDRQDYNVLRRRPRISKTERAWLLSGTLARRAVAKPV